MNGQRALSIIYIGVLHLFLMMDDDDDDDVGDDISDDDSDNDNGNRIVKHWESLMDHLCNVHDNCYRIELSSLERRKKKWLIPGILKYIILFCI